MAKILVADDNSNIQKMVGLALKDHGIDVVAVGNGEAAVRKISDVRPDLVLADVFMPVRNGYEVCKYVKDDSSLSHIPVILLVGAFDPLDEQEAQRVGADGVLKKPFVPPDPLISMVKSALLRASSAHTATAAEKTTASSVNGGANATQVVSGPPTVVAIPEEEPAVEDHSFFEEIPPKPETLEIESSGQPLAFGSLLETPAAEPADEAAYVSAPNPELADRDWNTAQEAEDEEEEEESASSSWRRDGGSDDLAPEPGAEAASEKAASRSKRRESWTPTREKTQDLLEDAVAPEFVAPAIVAPATAPLSMPSMNSQGAAPQNSPSIPTRGPELVESKKRGEAPAPSKAEIAPAASAGAAEGISRPSAKAGGENSGFSATNSPWEAEAQKAHQLASTWDAPPAAPTASAASELVVEEPQPAEPPQPEAPAGHPYPAAPR